MTSLSPRRNMIESRGSEADLYKNLKNEDLKSI